MTRMGVLGAFALVGFTTAAYGQQVTRPAADGITNFARLETTVACGGTTSASALPELKKMGFKSVINLRQASERNANIEEAKAVAQSAGLNYYHIPYNVASPDPALVDTFLKAITAPGSEPAFIHCAGGGRAAGLWFVKRVVVDRWAIDRAMTEAEALGLASEPVKKFVLGYVRSRGPSE